MTARSRIHAMFILDEAAETELDKRLDTLVAEAAAAALHAAADDIHHRIPDDERYIVKKTVVNILRRHANTAGAETTTPGTANSSFFQPGHTYIRESHGAHIEFRVTGVDTSPDGRLTVACGWRSDPYSGWARFDSDDLTGWTDTTGAGAS